MRRDRLKSRARNDYIFAHDSERMQCPLTFFLLPQGAYKTTRARKARIRYADARETGI